MDEDEHLAQQLLERAALIRMAREIVSQHTSLPGDGGCWMCGGPLPYCTRTEVIRARWVLARWGPWRLRVRIPGETLPPPDEFVDVNREDGWWKTGRTIDLRKKF